MSKTNIDQFKEAMETKLKKNAYKEAICRDSLETHLTMQYTRYIQTGSLKYLVNIANYCAMIWNDKEGLPNEDEEGGIR